MSVSVVPLLCKDACTFISTHLQKITIECLKTNNEFGVLIDNKLLNLLIVTNCEKIDNSITTLFLNNTLVEIEQFYWLLNLVINRIKIDWTDFMIDQATFQKMSTTLHIHLAQLLAISLTNCITRHTVQKEGTTKYFITDTNCTDKQMVEDLGQNIYNRYPKLLLDTTLEFVVLKLFRNVCIGAYNSELDKLKLPVVNAATLCKMIS